MKITFKKLVKPTPDNVKTIDKWVNDPLLVPLIRPMPAKSDITALFPVSFATLSKRLENECVYLIYLNECCVGQMGYQKNSELLYNNEPDAAWIGLMLGEVSARGIGVGMAAMDYLEEQISAVGLNRIELGVFEFNDPALKLYKKRGYQEIGRNKAFTYWNGNMWDNICMEKYL